MKNLNLVLVAGVGLLGCCGSAMAAPVCAAQNVTVGFACTLGDLTFTFEQVGFTAPGSTSGDTLSLEQPPTGISGNIDILGFQLFAASYPLDIHLVYEVQSTSADIIDLDSTFTPASGSPQIQESACSNDPEKSEGSCTALATVINSTGSITYTPAFGPVSTVWVDKDVTDTGFSSFTDSVEESSTVPEPATGLLLGAALCGLGMIRRKRFNPSR